MKDIHERYQKDPAVSDRRMPKEFPFRLKCTNRSREGLENSQRMEVAESICLNIISAS